MSRLAVALGSLLALAAGGCRAPGAARGGPAADASGAAPRAEPGTRIVCDYERPTGSNIPVRTCYRVLDDLQRDHARDAAIDALNRPHAQPISGR